MDFSTVVDNLLVEYFLLQPTQATDLGEHAYDHHWPDLTDEGHAAFSQWLREAETTVQALEPGALTRDEAIDRRILLENLAAMRFEISVANESSRSYPGAVNDKIEVAADIFQLCETHVGIELAAGGNEAVREIIKIDGCIHHWNVD